MRKLAIVGMIMLGLCGVAQATTTGGAAVQPAPSHHRPRYDRRRHHKKEHRRRKKKHHLVERLPAVIGVGNAPGCLNGADPIPTLRSYHASVLRVLLNSSVSRDRALACVRAAVAAGYKVHLAIQYDATWTDHRITARFRVLLRIYGAYLWAVSVGNEEELEGQSGAQYAAVWRLVEPIIAKLAPQAIRVAGNISVWGFPRFLQDAWAAGLPGAQAIAENAYTTPYAHPISQVLAWCRSVGLPLWITEGLDAPDAWASPSLRIQVTPLQEMAGVAVAEVWLA